MVIEDNTPTVCEDYIKDLGMLIKEYALEGREQAEKSGTDFNAGYMAAFSRVVSLMQEQAQEFGIPLEKIGLEGIDPYEDLV